jgi:phage-related protein
MRWSVETFSGVAEEMQALPAGLQGRMLRLFDLVESYGLDHLREPHVKHLDGKLWELRVKGPEGIARGIYVALIGRRVMVLHVFAKKTPKTPARALALARRRMESLG